MRAPSRQRRSPLTESPTPVLLRCTLLTMVKPKSKTKKPAGKSEEIEQLLADQTDVILEAVDERLDKKFAQVTTKLDGVMKEVQAHREEDKMGARLLRRHEDKLQDHEVRIATLERHT